MTDLLIYETGNGGDLALRGNDLVQVQGVENGPYLAMFGGGSWWGNYLIPAYPFGSQTEQAMNVQPLTSAGRIAIERAIKADLSYLNNIAGTTWTVSTAVTAVNTLIVTININGQLYNYEWNPDELFLNYMV